MARTVDLMPGPFVAIDFETADHGPDSACAVGLVRVDGGRITRRVRQLIRDAVHTHHGIAPCSILPVCVGPVGIN
jgi:DNA polymerase III epsilon subunit-like protein